MIDLLAHLMYIVIFINLFGTSIFLVLSILQNLFKLNNDLKLYLISMAGFIIPIYSFKVQLFDPESLWIPNFLSASIVWFVVFFALLLYKLITWGLVIFKLMSTKRTYKNKYVEDILKECCKVYSIKKVPKIVYLSKIDAAGIVGIIRPIIVLNKDICSLIDKEEIRIIISHELIHLKMKHIYLKRIIEIICCVHWFNPFIWYLKNKMALSFELECDQILLEHHLCSKKVYAELLIRLAEKTMLYDKNKYSSIPLKINNYKILKIRLKLLFTKKIKFKKLKYTATILMLLLIWGISVKFSEGYFYPYPAYTTKIEVGDYNE